MHFMIDTHPTRANLPAMEDVMNELNERLETMIALVADSFPADWSADDKRELAMRQLGMLEVVE